MARTFGRVTIDERGVRKAPFLFFFGSRFDLAWSDITGWATVGAALASLGSEQLVSRTLELHTAKGIHFADASGTEFDAMVEEVRRRLPDKETKSILEQMQTHRERWGNA
jgi:hypothetical protein